MTFLTILILLFVIAFVVDLVFAFQTAFSLIPLFLAVIYIAYKLTDKTKN